MILRIRQRRRITLTKGFLPWDKGSSTWFASAVPMVHRVRGLFGWPHRGTARKLKTLPRLLRDLILLSTGWLAVALPAAEAKWCAVGTSWPEGNIPHLRVRNLRDMPRGRLRALVVAP